MAEQPDRVQMRIDSQTAYDQIQIEAQERIDAMDARLQAEFESWTPEEQAEATAQAERWDRNSIEQWGATEQERWDVLQERTRASFINEQGRNRVVDRLVQDVLDEARMPSPYDDD